VISNASWRWYSSAAGADERLHVRRTTVRSLA